MKIILILILNFFLSFVVEFLLKVMLDPLTSLPRKQNKYWKTALKHYSDKYFDKRHFRFKIRCNKIAVNMREDVQIENFVLWLQLVAKRNIKM